MAAKRRAKFGKEDIGAITYVSAGSPAAMEFGLVGNVRCTACGTRISHVYMTDVGPLGGDCLATITGDETTRAAVRGLVTKLRSLPWIELYKFEVEQTGPRTTCVRAYWQESGRLYVIWCGALVPDIAASIMRDRIAAWAEERGLMGRPVSIVSAKR